MQTNICKKQPTSHFFVGCFLLYFLEFCHAKIECKTNALALVNRLISEGTVKLGGCGLHSERVVAACGALPKNELGKGFL